MGQSINELKARAEKGSKRAAKKLAQLQKEQPLPEYILVKIMSKDGAYLEDAYWKVEKTGNGKEAVATDLYQVKKDGTMSKRKKKLEDGDYISFNAKDLK